MTDAERIEQIRAREQAATPQNWSYDGMHNEIHCDALGEDFFLICSELRYHPTDKLLDSFGHTYNTNFDFIANCRQDVPFLLDYISRLEKQNERLKEERDAAIFDLSGHCEYCLYRKDCAKHDNNDNDTGFTWYTDCEYWQWRGLEPETTTKARGEE